MKITTEIQGMTVEISETDMKADQQRRFVDLVLNKLGDEKPKVGTIASGAGGGAGEVKGKVKTPTMTFSVKDGDVIYVNSAVFHHVGNGEIIILREGGFDELINPPAVSISKTMDDEMIKLPPIEIIEDRLKDLPTLRFIFGKVLKEVATRRNDEYLSDDDIRRQITHQLTSLESDTLVAKKGDPAKGEFLFTKSRDFIDAAASSETAYLLRGLPNIRRVVLNALDTIKDIVEHMEQTGTLNSREAVRKRVAEALKDSEDNTLVLPLILGTMPSCDQEEMMSAKLRAKANVMTMKDIANAFIRPDKLVKEERGAFERGEDEKQAEPATEPSPDEQKHRQQRIADLADELFTLMEKERIGMVSLSSNSKNHEDQSKFTAARARGWGLPALTVRRDEENRRIVEVKR